MRMKKIIYRLRLFFSRFKKYEHKNNNFIYEQEDGEV
jgi:hypothetical protein